MNLLIAEKPSVATGAYRELLEKVEGESFQKKDGYLQGKNWIISWCVGHLVGLSMPKAYGWEDWKIEHLPMIPSKWIFEVLPNTKKQYNTLAKLINTSDVIVNGGDAGREGELIVRLVLKQAKAESKILKRFWVNSFVIDDMIKAWKNLEPGENYSDLYRAALSRSIGDWIVGLNSTRAYSLATGVRGLSVGRVQTPTLGLIVKRDDEVENWQRKFYFQLVGKWKDVDLIYEKEKENKFKTENELIQIQNDVLNSSGKLITLLKTEKVVNPPKPFDLVELQKAANIKLGFKAADTLKYTQELYEKKFVTYPRTDSEYLPDNMLKEAYSLLFKLCDDDKHIYLKSENEKPSFFNSKKVTDHFAIIPTGETPVNISSNLTQLYNLIKDRFIVAFGKPYLFENTLIKVDCKGNIFKGSFNVSKDLGFKNLLKRSAEDNEDLNVNFIVNEEHLFTKTTIEKKEVTKPKYHTEASLLSSMILSGKDIEDDNLKEAMKERGLGTPATRANIIETLKKRTYIITKGKTLISTTKGRELIKLVDPIVSSAELTGEWEYKLNLMEKGKYEGGEFLKEIKSLVTTIVNQADKKGVEFKKVIDKDVPMCPKCQKLKLTKNDFGFFCNDGCGFKFFIKILNRKLPEEAINDLFKNGKTKTIKGFKGKKSKFDAPLVFNKEFEVVFDFKEANDDVSVKKVCPKCSNQTVQIKPKGAFCNLEKCGFKLWRSVASKELTDKFLYKILETGSTGVINGFKSKAGKPFKANLKLNKEKNGVEFVFVK